MVDFKAFSRLKNFFSRLNPMPFFKWKVDTDEIIPTLSSKELLEKVIEKYPEFKYIILVSIYHLINTKDEDKEYLTVLTKDLRLIADLIKGEDNNVGTPSYVETEGEKNNILIACHNHYFGAIIPSLGDICKALENNCNLISIVSENHIGLVVIDYNHGCDKNLINEFVLFHGYFDICFDLEKHNELSQLELLQITDDKKEKLKLESYDKFISENSEKFVNEFNIRFNKFNICEIYI